VVGFSQQHTVLLTITCGDGNHAGRSNERNVNNNNSYSINVICYWLS
jgi:hypothetical protein